MEDAVPQHYLGRFVRRPHVMGVLVVGLLASNILVGGLAWYTSMHQAIEITPFSGGVSYIKSNALVDTQYLSMMTENFIYSRLNITPETVRGSHKRLLSFVDSAQYPMFLTALNQEARAITSKKISSYFEIKDMRVDTKQLSCTVTGILKRAVGVRTPHEERAVYQLQYKYHLGQLLLTEFKRMEAKKDV